MIANDRTSMYGAAKCGNLMTILARDFNAGFENEPWPIQFGLLCKVMSSVFKYTITMSR